MPTSLAAETYARELGYLRYGLPLWIPEPPDGQHDVLIGDVGHIADGRFYRLFNATRSETDPVNDHRVPVDFQVLDLNERALQRVKGLLPPKFALSSQCVRKTECAVRIAASPDMSGLGELGFGYEFTSNRNDGALLLLKDRSNSEEIHTPNKKFVSYMLHNYQEWCNFASSVGGVDLEPEQLVFVRGWVKTSEWVVATFSNQNTAHEVSFRADAVSLATAQLSVTFSDQRSVAVIHRSGPVREDVGASQSETRQLEDQCIFLSFFKLKSRNKLLKNLLPSKIVAAAEPKDDEPHRSPSPEIDPLEASEDSGSEYSVQMEPTETTPWDPIDDVLDYILMNSEADIAIASHLSLRTLEWPIDNNLKEALLEGRPRVVLDVDEEISMRVGMLESESLPLDSELVPAPAEASRGELRATDEANHSAAAKEKDKDSPSTSSSAPPPLPPMGPSTASPRRRTKKANITEHQSPTVQDVALLSRYAIFDDILDGFRLSRIPVGKSVGSRTTATRRGHTVNSYTYTLPESRYDLALFEQTNCDEYHDTDHVSQNINGLIGKPNASKILEDLMAQHNEALLNTLKERSRSIRDGFVEYVKPDVRSELSANEGDVLFTIYWSYLNPTLTLLDVASFGSRAQMRSRSLFLYDIICGAASTFYTGDPMLRRRALINAYFSATAALHDNTKTVEAVYAFLLMAFYLGHFNTDGKTSDRVFLDGAIRIALDLAFQDGVMTNDSPESDSIVRALLHCYNADRLIASIHNTKPTLPGGHFLADLSGVDTDAISPEAYAGLGCTVIASTACMLLFGEALSTISNLTVDPTKDTTYILEYVSTADESLGDQYILWADKMSQSGAHTLPQVQLTYSSARLRILTLGLKHAGHSMDGVFMKRCLLAAGDVLDACHEAVGGQNERLRNLPEAQFVSVVLACLVIVMLSRRQALNPLKGLEDGIREAMSQNLDAILGLFGSANSSGRSPDELELCAGYLRGLLDEAVSVDEHFSLRVNNDSDIVDMYSSWI